MTEPSPGLVADSSSEGLVAQLEEVWTAVSLLCATLTAEQWELPTSCPEWSVKDQVIHLIGTESMLDGRPTPQIPGASSAPPFGDHVRNDIGRFNEAWIVALGHLDGPTILDLFNEVTRERLGALRALDWTAWDEVGWTPVGQAPYRRFMQIRVFDCWVHFQDIRSALGISELGASGPNESGGGASGGGDSWSVLDGIDGGAAAEQSVDEVVRALGLLIGKRAGAPEGSTVALTLTGPVRRQIFVAVEGRATVVARLDARPTVSLTTDSVRFVNLACGRIEGDTDLGQRIIGHLAFTV
jgi:uncharacterized protein (TIGR03083 family)